MTQALIQPTIDSIPGFSAAGVHCGIKKNGALDLALIICEDECTAAGVFTTNIVKAAPVILDTQHITSHGERIRAVVVNSGCANAVTGQQGMENARETARYVAYKMGCAPEQVLVMSTGVIGEQLPMDKIKHGVDLAVEALSPSQEAWSAAARAIMTTDTRPKAASSRYEGEGGFTVGGIAKGAGMIAPDMATLLGLLVTDAAIELEPMQALLRNAARQSFNHIVVDGDMSTNDTLLMLASGRVSLDEGDAWAIAQDCVTQVSQHLAQEIVRDAEGGSKLVKIIVQGTRTEADARQIADAIATSPLVKTAFYGSDPNWGRILAAVGRAGVVFNPENLDLGIVVGLQDPVAVVPEGRTEGILWLVRHGTPINYTEEDAAAIMQQAEFTVYVDCGGNKDIFEWVLTCDLSHDYVSINADYRS